MKCIIERLGIKIKDKVRVVRSGDVIPKVVSVIDSDNPMREDILMPETCPSCKSTLVKEDIFLRCINLECESIKFENLKFFVSKEGADIEFVGPELVERLKKADKLANISGFFKLTKDDLLCLERMGEKLADKIMASINSKRVMPLEVFLKSIGIRNVGEHVAKVVSKELITLEAVRAADFERLTSIREIGPEVANSIRNFFDSNFGAELIESLSESGVTIADYAGVQSKSSVFLGKTFVVTGTLSLPRKEIENLIASLGGKTSSAVSKSTDFVLAGESAGSKLAKANELGIKVLSENEFILMSGIKNENH